ELLDKLGSNFAPVLKLALGRTNPLPYLRARDLGRGSVFHEVVNGDATIAIQPRAQIMDADIDVAAQPFFGNGLLWSEVEQISRRDVHVVALLVDLIGTVAQYRHEFLHGYGDQTRVSHPAAIVAVGGVALFVRTYACHGGFVFLGIVLDGNESTHAAYSRRIALV